MVHKNIIILGIILFLVYNYLLKEFLDMVHNAYYVPY